MTTTTPTITLFYTTHSDVDWQVDDGDVILYLPMGALNAGPATQALIQLMEALADGLALEAQAGLAAPENAIFDQLYKLGLLGLQLKDEQNRQLLNWYSDHRGVDLQWPNTTTSPGDLKLSSVVFIRFINGVWVMRSPLFPHHLRWDTPWLGRLLSAFAKDDRDWGSLVGACGLSVNVTHTLVSLLQHLGFLLTCDESGLSSEEHDPMLRQWEFHDLLFHTCSRAGYRLAAQGATMRFARQEIEPLLHPHAPVVTIPLYAPNSATLAREDLPFFQVTEKRRSIRSNSDREPSLNELGEFLYRTVRIQQREMREYSDDLVHEISRRPNPAGGACHELEIYILAQRCRGLAAGLYHYNPAQHGLGLVTGWNENLTQLVNDAQTATTATRSPDLMIVLSARFQRMSWRYEAMTYAAILKHVGVLFHGFYLAATAMGLSPCGIGCGHSPRFADVIGRSWLYESSVGEFMLNGPVEAATQKPPSQS